MGDTSNNFHFFVLHNCNILSPLMPTHETTDKPIKLHLNRQLERENVRFKSRRKYLKKKTSILQRSYFSSGNYKTTHFLICVKSEAKAELQAGKEKTSAVPSNTTHPPRSLYSSFSQSEKQVLKKQDPCQNFFSKTFVRNVCLDKSQYIDMRL